jgi:hypothetical protein
MFLSMPFAGPVKGIVGFCKEQIHRRNAKRAEKYFYQNF